jgi:hypothetical protein
VPQGLLTSGVCQRRPRPARAEHRGSCSAATARGSRQTPLAAPQSRLATHPGASSGIPDRPGRVDLRPPPGRRAERAALADLAPDPNSSAPCVDEPRQDPATHLKTQASRLVRRSPRGRRTTPTAQSAHHCAPQHSVHDSQAEATTRHVRRPVRTEQHRRVCPRLSDLPALRPIFTQSSAGFGPGSSGVGQGVSTSFPRTWPP